MNNPILLKICYITDNGMRDCQCMSALQDSKTSTFQQGPTPLNVNHAALAFSNQHARKAAAKPVLHTQPRSGPDLYTRESALIAHTTGGCSISTLEPLGMIFLGSVKVKTLQELTPTFECRQDLFCLPREFEIEKLCIQREGPLPQAKD